MPDLETFFDFGGTLELVVVAEDSTPAKRAKRDIVISEVMWAVDRGIDNAFRDSITVQYIWHLTQIEDFNPNGNVDPFQNPRRGGESRVR